MSKRTSTNAKPSPEELLPMYQELLPRPVIQRLVRESKVTLYQRLLTPLVVLWGLVYQRLNPDHTCDAVVSYFHTGAVDGLDPSPRQPAPLSERLISENTSAYVQGRQRLPLTVLQGAVKHVQTVVTNWMAETPAPAETNEVGTWRGHPVRLLDGTTFRLRPTEDWVKTYGQAQNQQGTNYWVIVKSLASFCLRSHTLVGVAEGRGDLHETALVRSVMAQDPPGSVYVEDRGLGTYRVAQVANQAHHWVVCRLNRQMVKPLLKSTDPHGPATLRSGEERRVVWHPTAKTQREPDLPAAPLEGRLIYFRLHRDGFRPIDLYLFTTLLDAEVYPAEALLELYGWRWQVEIDYRHIKITLDLATFDVKTAEMFRKELLAGLLVYNLIRACMTQAALKAGRTPLTLSFSQCWRRVRDVLTHGIPAWVSERGLSAADYLLDRLAQCTLPHQPNKVCHEPRAVRRRPAVFPALKGSRHDARQKLRLQLAATALS